MLFTLKDKRLVYCIPCLVNDKVYVVSSISPHDRLYQHLVSGNNSNLALQAEIDKYGLRKFTVLVFEFVKFPQGMDLNTYIQLNKNILIYFPRVKLIILQVHH